MSNPAGAVLGLGVAGTVAMAAVIGVFGSWYTVDQGERCVILRNGAITGISEPGWHGKVPIIDDVECIDFREQVWEGPADAYSRDQQPANIMVTVNWRAAEGQAAAIYSNLGGLAGVESRIIAARVPQAVRTVFGQFNAATAISERARLNVEVENAVRDAVGATAVIESVQISIDFSDTYERSVEERMLAEVEVAKLRQNAEREKVQAEITVTIAEAEAKSTLAKAEANATAVRLRGEADAAAIAAKGKALRDNPELINLISAERWNGALPSTMVPGGAVPFVSVDR